MFSLEELNEHLDLIDGVFYWKKCPRRSIIAGQPAGYTREDGYHIIAINGKDYYTHKLVYLFYTGIYPKYLDHIDTDPTNNDISNLRVATHSQNMCNQKLSIKNTSGYKGICFVNKRNYFLASIKKADRKYQKTFHIGAYIDKESALQAAIAWITNLRVELHKEFANHG
jgi:hypothetical protein